MDWKLPALRSIAALLAGLGLTDRSVLADRAREIRVPTLVVGGAGSPAFLQQAVKSVAQALPDARALPAAGPEPRRVQGRQGAHASHDRLLRNAGALAAIASAINHAAPMRVRLTALPAQT